MIKELNKSLKVYNLNEVGHLKKGIILILALVGIIFCIGIVSLNSASYNRLNAPEQKVIYEGDVGGPDILTKYVQVNSSNVYVEISNVTIYNDPYFNSKPALEITALDVETQEGQSLGNYVGHTLDFKIFDNLTNGYSSNITLTPKFSNDPGNKAAGPIKSIAIVTQYSKAHIRILA